MEESALIDTLRQSETLTQRGLTAMRPILHVPDKDVLAFYQTCNLFQPFTDDPMRLFVLIHVVAMI